MLIVVRNLSACFLLLCIVFRKRSSEQLIVNFVYILPDISYVILDTSAIYVFSDEVTIIVGNNTAVNAKRHREGLSVFLHSAKPPFMDKVYYLWGVTFCIRVAAHFLYA